MSAAELPSNVCRSRDLPFEQGGAPGALAERYAWASLKLRDHLGLKNIGAHLEQLEPGRCSCPMHYHIGEEEAFHVIEGELVLRVLRQERDEYEELLVRAGQSACFSAGTGLAHQFFNRSDQRACFFAVSNQVPDDIVVYPDGGKALLKSLRQFGVFLPDGAKRTAEEQMAEARRSAQARHVRTVDSLDGVVCSARGPLPEAIQLRQLDRSPWPVVRGRFWTACLPVGYRAALAGSAGHANAATAAR